MVVVVVYLITNTGSGNSQDLGNVLSIMASLVIGVPALCIAVSGGMFRRAVQASRKLNIVASIGLLVPIWILSILPIVSLASSGWRTAYGIFLILVLVLPGILNVFFALAQSKYVKSLAASPQPIQQPAISEVPAEETRTIT